MKKKLTTSMIGILLLSQASVSTADTYQFETGYSYGEIEADFNRNNIFVTREPIEAEVNSAFITAYLKKVDVSKGPLAEAAFLNKSSSLSLNFSNIEREIANTSSEIDALGVSGRFVSSNDLIFDASYSKNDRSNSFGNEDDDNDYSVGFGAYLHDSASIVFEYAKEELDSVEEYSLNTYTLTQLSYGHIAYNVNLAYIDTDDDESGYDIEGELTYYITPKIGFGLNAGYDASPSSDEQTYGVLLSYFPINNISLSARYQEDNSNYREVELWALGLQIRL